MQRIVGLVVALLILSAFFGVIERLWPSSTTQRRSRQSLLTDLTWWGFTPLIGKVFAGVVVSVFILVVARLIGQDLTVDELKGLTQRDTFVSRQPLGVQLVMFFVIADLMAYWMHRAHHTFERLWQSHAVHHSSTELNWLSSVRVHPFNEVLQNAAIASPLVLLGFETGTVAAYLPFITLYAIFIHANVRWDFGPLRYVIATPAFHRWHHSAEADALNRNFAGLFPATDWLFGTLYLPKGVQPSRFGVNDLQVPGGFLAQLAFPLRRRGVRRDEAPLQGIAQTA
jgi:sterol desaturase/sphingolipid hydroxylase (fatty acid hydroxylase superfamily)